MEPQLQGPFSRARPRSEWLKRYNAMQAAKKQAAEEARHVEEDVDFSAESVIISTPVSAPLSAPVAKSALKPVININYRGRVIDDILRKEHDEGIQQAAITRKNQDSMDLLRKLSRVGTPSPPQPKTSRPLAPKTGYEISSGRQPLSDVVSALPVPHARHITSRRIMSEPVHPKSALEAVVIEAKEGRDPHQYGDETMASLENILHPSIDPTNSTFTNEPTPKQHEPLEKPLTQIERDRRQEKLALEAMSKRLTSTSSNLRDANKGLRRIENRIEAATGESSHVQTPQKDHADTHVMNTQSNAQIINTASTLSTEICSHCGRTSRSLWRGLWSELCEKFYTFDSTRHIHLTWLGWTFILWWVWFLLENVLCTEFCNYIEGPVVPFVTLNLTVRRFLPILRPLFAFLAWSSGTVLELLFDDLAASSRTVTATAVQSTIVPDSVWATTTRYLSASATRVVQSAMEAVDEAGLIWDDEFIV